MRTKIMIKGVDISKLEGLDFDLVEVDLCDFINGCRRPLDYLGISEAGGIVTVTTDVDVVQRVKYLISLVGESCDLLEDTTLDLVFTYSSDAIDYYTKFQDNVGDSTAFDYHGTRVQVVLDVLLALLENR